MDKFSFSTLTNMLPNLSSPPAEDTTTNDDPLYRIDTTTAEHDTSSEPQTIEPRPITPDASKPKSNLDLLNECDSFPYYHSDPAHYEAHTTTYYHLRVLAHPETTLGYVLPSVAEVLRGLPAWTLDDTERTLTLTQGDDEPTRSAIVAATTSAMRATSHFAILSGWRNELYPVYSPNRELLFNIERAASALFGVVSYGCHMTAYVLDEERKEMKIWVPRRSKTKSTYPGMLDNTVAGGLATGEDAFEGLVREASEEASLPEDLVRKGTKAVGAVTYFHIRDSRAGGETGLLQPEVQYIFDLELDHETKPEPCDDEVEEFHLMNVAEVRKRLSEGEFKPNCAVVLLDFFVRHGILTCKDEGYLEIASRLHRVLEFPIR